MRTRARGFNLLEVVVSCVLLSTAMLCAFEFFEFGSRVFRGGLMRQGLQAQVRRSVTPLDQDLRRTDLSTVSVIAKAQDATREILSTSGALVERDGLCLAALSNWNLGTNYDTLTSRPMWDRYVVYYATTEAEGARLIRQTVRPPGSPYLSNWGVFTTATSLSQNPALNSGPIENTRVLADQVEEFHVVLDAPTSAVIVKVKFRATGGLRVGTAGKNLDESLEAKFQIHPENS